MSGLSALRCLPWSLPTHKDLEVQAETRSSIPGIEPAGWVVHGWRQVVWQEVVAAGRCCSSARIDPGVVPRKEGGRGVPPGRSSHLRTGIALGQENFPSRTP